MTKHYTYGGSTMARTMACPAWPRLAKDMPKSPESDAAAEGTLLHNCMEEFYDKDSTVASMLSEGRSYKHVQLTEELVEDKLTPAIQVTESILNTYNINEYMCEPFVEIADDIGGSIDFIGVSGDGKTVLILDYKFGYYPVSATKNKQLNFYALCASLDDKTSHFFENAETVLMAIVQPTTEERYSLTSTPMAELDSFEADCINAINLSREPDTQPCAGSHCKFCPAEVTCPAKTGQALKAKMMQPQDLSKLSEMLTLADELEPWIRQVRKVAHEQLERGQDVDGYKLVQKRATRKWADEKAVADIIRKARKIKLEEGFDMKLKSPAQLEKLCGKKGVDFSKYDRYTECESKGTTLATSDDPRLAVTNTANQLEELTKLI